MKSECSACAKIFKSVAAFDKHRTGSYGETMYKHGNPATRKVIGHTPPARRCMTTEEMLAVGMCLNEKGWWIASVYDASIHAKHEEGQELLEDDPPV